MQKCFIDMKKSLRKATLALFFLSILALATTLTPIGKAANLSVTLNPAQGPPGTIVLIVISNFQTPNVLSVTFGTTNVRTITAHTYSTASMDFQIPQVSPGTYTVTVTDSTGGVATTTFTVTQASSTIPEETPIETPEETPAWLSPTDSPAAGDTGFWSPLTVGIIAAVIALAGFTTFLYVKRGRQETPSAQDTTQYKPRSSVQATSSYKPASSVQDTPLHGYRSSVPPTKSPTSTKTSSQPPPFTKVCRHCKQNVRDDLNVCPYCFKRLR